jgi:hypothetical protein
MKKFLLIFVCITTTFARQNFGQSNPQKGVQPLLTDYYNIKNALVAGDAGSASAYATLFMKDLNSIDYKIISEGNVEILLTGAGKIAASKDLKTQRATVCKSFGNMTVLAKQIKLSDAPVYVQYCPMKKASWLSNEKVIKNPYFGSSKLSCGEVKDTIK